ncbi:hypothetical protein HanIR_Chr10g0497341 [Helianthus annuus]|nr:hypothetical protein HanIR_Chr10g0497341 [Helianthus annuus]
MAYVIVFLFYMWNLIYFQSITYFLYFFSLCALFLKAHAFFAPCAKAPGEADAPRLRLASLTT